MNNRYQNGRITKTIIIISFVLFYISSMLLATYVEKENFEDNIYSRTQYHLSQVKNKIESMDSLTDENGNFTKKAIISMNQILSSQTSCTGEYLQINIGILDCDGNVIAKTQNGKFYGIGYTLDEGFCGREFDFEQHLSEEEMEQLLTVLAEEYVFTNSKKVYSVEYYYDDQRNTLVLFYITRAEWSNLSQSGATLAYQSKINEETVFEWRNEEYLSQYPNKSEYYSSGSIATNLTFPYLSFGKEEWETWKDDESLQNLNEGVKNTDLAIEANYSNSFDVISKTIIDRISFADLSVIYPEDDIIYYNSMNGVLYKDDYRIQINVSARPWHAAVSALKEIYVYAAAFMMACMFLVLHMTEKNIKKQIQLEEMRRDFTNAIAHELKTPLCSVRGLAENIDIEESQETRSYFVKSIVSQTEVMDKLVKEMLLLSKLDSNRVKLQTELISVRTLIEEGIQKLQYQIEGKNVIVDYDVKEDFVIKGDKTFLDKAIFSLLENAVTYNKRDGIIRIKIDKSKLEISNTADPIPKEDLEHVCDMFFTGNKSRSSAENHKGLGLYLAKRIFNVYKIILRVDNIEDGVSVKIES